MRVTKRGQLHAERVVGKRDRCSSCGTEVAFDEADAGRVRYVSDGFRGGYVLYWHCPTCGSREGYVVPSATVTEGR